MQNGLVQCPHVAVEHQQGFLSCKVPRRDALAPHWLLSQEFQCWKEECPRNLAVKISGNSNRRLLISKIESELAWWDLFTPPLWLPEIQPQPTQVLLLLLLSLTGSWQAVTGLGVPWAFCWPAQGPVHIIASLTYLQVQHRQLPIDDHKSLCTCYQVAPGPT